VDVIAALEGLRISHYECEDCWYSCPKSTYGCCDESRKGCDCGAEDHNHRLDEIIDYLKRRVGDGY
jgi:hypothetical protein